MSRPTPRLPLHINHPSKTLSKLIHIQVKQKSLSHTKPSTPHRLSVPPGVRTTDSDGLLGVSRPAHLPLLLPLPSELSLLPTPPDDLLAADRRLPPEALAAELARRRANRLRTSRALPRGV